MSTQTARMPRTSTISHAAYRDPAYIQVHVRIPRRVMKAIDAKLLLSGDLTRSDLFESLATNWLADPDRFKVRRPKPAPAKAKQVAPRWAETEVRTYMEVLGALIARGEVDVVGRPSDGPVIGEYSDGVFAIGIGASIAAVNARLLESGQAPLAFAAVTLRRLLAQDGVLVEFSSDPGPSSSWRSPQLFIRGAKMRVVYIRAGDLVPDDEVDAVAVAAPLAEPVVEAALPAVAPVVAPRASDLDLARFFSASTYVDPRNA